MATSTRQKQELFRAIWAIAEDLRNSVDGWEQKIRKYPVENNYVGTIIHELEAETL